MKEERRKQVIFIASCGHSGSTILELLLTSNLHCVGIGEAFQLVDPRNRIIDHVEKYTCACGDPIETCELWGSIIEDLHQKRDLPVAEKYSIIFQNVSDHCKTDCIIDSSKVMGALESIARIPDVSVKVVHILRDVRAYWVSIKKGRIRRNERRLRDLIRKFGMAGFYKYLQRNRLYVFQDWYRTNKHILRTIRRLKLPAVTLSYEDLCLNTDATLSTLAEFLGVRLSLDPLGAGGAHNHNVFGNRLRHDPERRKKLSYDYQWLGHTDWMFPAMCMPHVMKFNKNRT